eukprot:jgi/Chrzof1/8573/Cz03g16010.t1
MARAKQQKPQLPTLESGPLPLSSLRESARKQLVDLIDSKRGKKALLLDPALSGPLTLLDASLSELFTEHGIVKLLYLERKRLDDAIYQSLEPRLSDVRPIIYVVRATLENAQLIAWQIKNSSRATQQHEFSVFWVPRRSIACERLLEEEGVYGDLVQGEFPFDLVPLDDDVLSLELDNAFRECTLEGDPSSLFYAASAIMKLQQMYGLIPHIQGKGPAAAAVKDMCLKMRKEAPITPCSSAQSRIDRVILLDREVDVVTPMVTQITFEGLIDEISGIHHGAVQWTPRERRPGEAGAATASNAAAAVAGGDGSKGRGGSTLINSTDPFYREFRDLPYYLTSQRLQQYARDARKEYTELGTKDLSELKTFVKGLPKLLLLDRLSDIASPVAEVVKQQAFHDRLKMEQDMIDNFEVEDSVNFIQDLIWRSADMLQVLRLLVLFSATNNGIPRKQFDALRMEFLAAYGHQHLLTLNNLEKSGLLRSHGTSRGNFASLRKQLRLMVPDDDQMTNPTDVSYIYKGYAPITIRLVEQALKDGWGPVSDILPMLPGAQFDSLQVQEPNGQVVDKQVKPGGNSATAQGQAPSSAAASSSSSSDIDTVLVVFLGGCTFSEISALRFLSTRPECRARFLVLTTKIINGRTLLDTFIDHLAKEFPGGGHS